MTKKIFLFSIIIIFIFSFLIIEKANALPCNCNGVYKGEVGTDAECTALCSSSSGGGTSLPNPLGNDNPSIQILIGKIINAVLGIVGSLALIMFIYGGFTWMLAAGNQQAVQKGKDILTWATVGLIVIFASYALVNFVLTAVTSA